MRRRWPFGYEEFFRAARPLDDLGLDRRVTPPATLGPACEGCRRQLIAVPP